MNFRHDCGCCNPYSSLYPTPQPTFKNSRSQVLHTLRLYAPIPCSKIHIQYFLNTLLSSVKAQPGPSSTLIKIPPISSPRLIRLQCGASQHGDVFTLQLPGQRMAFVFHPGALRSFFTAPESQISFQPAVVHFTERVFGMPSGNISGLISSVNILQGLYCIIFMPILLSAMQCFDFFYRWIAHVHPQQYFFQFIGRRFEQLHLAGACCKHVKNLWSRLLPLFLLYTVQRV